MNDIFHESSETLSLKIPPLRADRFQSAAVYYEKGRIRYAEALIGRVAQVTGLEPGQRVLDLGCGPATLSRRFAALGYAVVAMDPSPEMLQAGRELAGDAPNITFVQGSSYDLGPAMGSFRLVTMGRSFHWMDRFDTLRRLDGMIVPDGAVALFHDSAPDIPANAWRKSWQEIRERYEPDTEPHSRHAAGWVRHEAILLDSAFSRMERFGVVERRPLDVETLIERTLSMSSTSPSHIGEKAVAMAEDIRAELSGIREEVVETEALVAWRPEVR